MLDDKNRDLNVLQDVFKQEENNSISHYLSFRFYKENLDHLTGMTKDSINNFLKTISEIEEEFLNILNSQRMKNIELHDFGFDTEIRSSYMEENY